MGSLIWCRGPVLSDPFILREPQDERLVKGLTTKGRGKLETNYLAVSPEPVEGEQRITTQSLKREGTIISSVVRDEPSCKIVLI